MADSDQSSIGAATLSRSVVEWTEDNHDKPIPPRVKLRVKVRANECCENCGNRGGPGAQVDHIVALANGGEHRETNLQYLCKNCHAAKTRVDVAEKSRTAKTAKRMAGFKTEKRGYWSLSKKMNGDVCRWNPETRKYDILVYSRTPK